MHCWRLTRILLISSPARGLDHRADRDIFVAKPLSGGKLALGGLTVAINHLSVPVANKYRLSARWSRRYDKDQYSFTCLGHQRGLGR
jgi:hypothetical protein